MVKHSQQEHRSNPHDNQQSCKYEGSPKQKSLEAVQLPTGDRHNRDLLTHVEHSGLNEVRP
jgi:hypothetical protein